MLLFARVCRCCRARVGTRVSCVCGSARTRFGVVDYSVWLLVFVGAVRMDNRRGGAWPGFAHSLSALIVCAGCAIDMWGLLLVVVRRAPVAGVEVVPVAVCGLVCGVVCQCLVCLYVCMPVCPCAFYAGMHERFACRYVCMQVRVHACMIVRECTIVCMHQHINLCVCVCMYVMYA